MGIAKSLTRIWSVTLKEFIEVLRRPGAVLSLILGPFLILAIFGVGYSGERRPLDALLVIPDEPALPQSVTDYQDLAGHAFRIIGVTRDHAGATAALERQEIDLVVAVPEDFEANVRAGRQSIIQVEYNLIDPVRIAYALFLSERLATEVNREVIRTAVEAVNRELSAAAPGVPAIPSNTAAEPAIVSTRDLAPTGPSVVSFFGPAVVALILQHMALTLAAMSLVRERHSGVMELFRISPTGALELLLGKYLSIGFLNAVIAALVLWLLVAVLRVPFLASVAAVAGVIGLLLLASLGLGLLISVFSDSERQAVQLSLLVLLASVFFSGFVLSIDEFAAPVRGLAYALPVTHGIRLVQDLLLRGTTIAWWEAWVLGGLAGAFFVVTWLRLRYLMARG